MKVHKVILHQFDGTLDGFKLMLSRQLNNYDLLGKRARFNNGIASFDNGLILKKGDHYTEFVEEINNEISQSNTKQLV